MKQCNNCKEMYDLPHMTKGFGKLKFFGDYCPYCETFNSDINKYSIISFIIAIVIGLIIYLINLA